MPWKKSETLPVNQPNKLCKKIALKAAGPNSLWEKVMDLFLQGKKSHANQDTKANSGPETTPDPKVKSAHKAQSPVPGEDGANLHPPKKANISCILQKKPVLPK